ncbi:MAG: hypothetical protein KC636_28845, partial [Myxococcales bacterium]|nr:hypothetical protein [Myxococcales bacterium]
MTLLAGGSCKSKDADKEPEPTEESVEPPEVDVDALLELDERAFPLLIWSAFSVERDYFDRSRLDPRAQLLSALTNLGLHRPEFFAEPKGEDTVLVTVVAQSREFSVAVDGPKGGLVAAAERLEEILEFTREVLELTGNDERELEYAAINGLLAPLDPHTILLDPKEHDDLGVKTRGQFGGIGAEILADARR